MKRFACIMLVFTTSIPASARIGRRFPFEKKIIPDPVTGVPLTFLTSTPAGGSKIYQTHPQWTSGGKWLIFRTRRADGQAFAVNEETGDIVQVTEHGYTGTLCVAPKTMRLFHTRVAKQLASDAPKSSKGDAPPSASPAKDGTPPTLEVVAIDLAKVFADSKAGTMKPAAEYEHVFGTIPAAMGSVWDLALDADEEAVYFQVGPEVAAKHLPAGTKIEPSVGPRGLGAGPRGIGSMDLKAGEAKVIVAVPFGVGHIQSNPFVPGEIVFCWETGGKSPQRTWVVRADGTGLRPLYPEAPYDWVTHEAVITKDEVAHCHSRPSTAGNQG